MTRIFGTDAPYGPVIAIGGQEAFERTGIRWM